MTAAGDDGRPFATRQEMLGIKLWPEVRDAEHHEETLVPTIEQVKALGDERHPDTNPKRRMTPAGRDLLALGWAALQAGYEPGDTIPAKRKRAKT